MGFIEFRSCQYFATKQEGLVKRTVTSLTNTLREPGTRGNRRGDGVGCVGGAAGWGTAAGQSTEQRHTDQLQRSLRNAQRNL